jgi:hypothetical protein
MLNAVRMWLRRSVPVTLKRLNVPGMTYDEVMEFLRELLNNEVRNVAPKLNYLTIYGRVETGS